MVFRVFIANLTPDQVALIGQSHGFSGTVYSALGFGAWGIEPTTVAELGGVAREDVRRFVDAILVAAPKEEAVYVHDGVTGAEWGRDGPR